MPIKILTNNFRVYELFKNKSLSISFVDGHAIVVINKCFELIHGGWRLAADPLAGYFSRPNPYHTIFLQGDTPCQARGEDLIRLERVLEQWGRYDNIIPMTSTLWRDYGELDCSIAMSTLEGLVKSYNY